MCYTYVLFSKRDEKLYVGYTQDLNLRMNQHQKGEVQSTKARRPLTLIYYEASINQWDAVQREKYLKTHYGRMYIHKRLKTWFQEHC